MCVPESTTRLSRQFDQGNKQGHNQFLPRHFDEPAIQSDSRSIYATITGCVDSIRILFGGRTKIRGQWLVCEEMMTIAKMAPADRGVTAEFAGVGDEQGGPAIGDDGLPRLNFVRVKIEQGAILIDAADTEDAEIGPEAGEKTCGGVADDVPVKRTQCSACDRDLDVGILRKRRRHVQIVGDDPKILPAGQRLCDVFGRRPWPIMRDAPSGM